MVTLAQLYRKLSEGLAPLGLLPSSLRLEAKELTCLAAGIGPAEFWLRQDTPLLPEAEEKAETYLARRLGGEPLAYILGAWDFYGRTFRLNSACLIPRADSETMMDAALRLLPRAEAPLRVLDLCCGSGCLGITLALELAKRGVAVSLTLADISQDALHMAEKNACLLGVSPAPEIWQTDALSAPVPAERWDVILYNPPYLTSDELAGPYKETLAFEPALALDGGPDGLTFYRAFADRWVRALRPGGWAFLEIGHTQADAVLSLLSDKGTAEAHCDLAGIQRIISLRKPERNVSQ